MDLRACFKIGRGPAARDFGRGQGGEFRASPQRAVRSEPTPATGKRPAARRVFGQKAAWLRCSSLTDPWRVCKLPVRKHLVAPRHPAFCPKTGPLRILKQALSILDFWKSVACWTVRAGNEQDLFKVMALSTALAFGALLASLESLRSGAAGFSFQVSFRTLLAFLVGGGIALGNVRN